MFLIIKQKLYSFLRWSEKFTKTDMVYLTKSGFWLMFGQILTFFSSLILSIAFANLLTKETYGTYKYIVSLAGMLAITNLPGINIAVTQAVASGHNFSVNKIIRSRMSWGLLGTFIGVIFAFYNFYHHKTDLFLLMIIMAIFLPLMDPFTVYDAYLQGKKRFKLSSLYNISSYLTVTTISLIIVFIFRTSPAIVLAYFFSWTIIRFIFFRLTKFNKSKNNTSDINIINYGKNLSLINFLPVIAAYLDKILIFNFIGAKELAIYSIVLVPVEQIRGMFKIFPNLIFPKFSANKIEKIKENIGLKCLYLFLVVFIVILLYIITAKFIFLFFFPKYSNYVFLSQIFSLSLLIILNHIPYSLMQAKKMTTKLYRYNIITSLFQLTFLFIFYKYYGLLGIIISLVISRLFKVLLAYYYCFGQK